MDKRQPQRDYMNQNIPMCTCNYLLDYHRDDCPIRAIIKGLKHDLSVILAETKIIKKAALKIQTYCASCDKDKSKCDGC